MIATSQGRGTIRASEGTIRDGEGKIRADRIFNATSSFKNFEIQRYYQNEPKFNGVYSRNNLSKIKDGTYVISLDEFKSIGTHWIASNTNKIVYLIVLELNIFQKKLENSKGTKI